MLLMLAIMLQMVLGEVKDKEVVCKGTETGTSFMEGRPGKESLRVFDRRILPSTASKCIRNLDSQHVHPSPEQS